MWLIQQRKILPFSIILPHFFYFFFTNNWHWTYCMMLPEVLQTIKERVWTKKKSDFSRAVVNNKIKTALHCSTFKHVTKTSAQCIPKMGYWIVLLPMFVCGKIYLFMYTHKGTHAGKKKKLKHLDVWKLSSGVQKN